MSVISFIPDLLLEQSWTRAARNEHREVGARRINERQNRGNDDPEDVESSILARGNGRSIKLPRRLGRNKERLRRLIMESRNDDRVGLSEPREIRVFEDIWAELAFPGSIDCHLIGEDHLDWEPVLSFLDISDTPMKMCESKQGVQRHHSHC